MLSQYYLPHMDSIYSLLNFRVQCNERGYASIEGREYEWDGAPNSGPWGALGRQLAKKAVLKSPKLLTIEVESGDSIDRDRGEPIRICNIRFSS